ncbi:MAG: SDR family NAD(P)-dependent oxidoreductase [Hyphomonadaceae bacterium]|nr:SDR family NAD(P)-dependent oxidoreductase [Hyphomonadaceae bacterium]
MTLPSLPEGYRAAVFGASGGIGAALVNALASDDRCALIHAGSRRNHPAETARIRPFTFDLQDEWSIEGAASLIAADDGVDLVLVATGRLHAPGLQPEKSNRSLEAAALHEAFAINTIGPALIAKRMLPLLPRNRRAIFGVLSARVGSISDNRLGGWHSYRASKAALNMLVCTFAIEQARTHPQTVCVALHPGTVDTGLSKPFQSGVATEKLFTPARSANHLLAVLDTLTPAQSGRVFAWDGQEITP